MVQQETPSSPVQLASEGIQAIVGLLTEHRTCKTTGSLALVFTLDRYANLVEYFMMQEYKDIFLFTVKSSQHFLRGVRGQLVVCGMERLSVLKVGLPE